MAKGDQRPFETRGRFAVGAARGGLGAGLPEIGHSLVPYLPPRCMMREAFNLLDQPIRI